MLKPRRKCCRLLLWMDGLHAGLLAVLWWVSQPFFSLPSTLHVSGVSFINQTGGRLFYVVSATVDCKQRCKWNCLNQPGLTNTGGVYKMYLKFIIYWSYKNLYKCFPKFLLNLGTQLLGIVTGEKRLLTAT